MCTLNVPLLFPGAGEERVREAVHLLLVPFQPSRNYTWIVPLMRCSRENKWLCQK